MPLHVEALHAGVGSQCVSERQRWVLAEQGWMPDFTVRFDAEEAWAVTRLYSTAKRLRATNTCF